MSMSKQDFIALADAIRYFNSIRANQFDAQQIDVLADFCQCQNGNFKRDRWLSYIAGECGPNGGAIKQSK
jgi:hypothetical protein